MKGEISTYSFCKEKNVPVNKLHSILLFVTLQLALDVGKQTLSSKCVYASNREEKKNTKQQYTYRL